MTYHRGDPLTVSQLITLELVAQGLSRAQIARKLSMSERTIKSRMEVVRLKLGAGSDAQAVHLAHEQGWLMSARPRYRQYPVPDWHRPSNGGITLRVVAEEPDQRIA